MQETREEIKANLQKVIDEYIKSHDKYCIKELCKIESYALAYFVEKAMDAIVTLEHITNIINK